MKIVDLFSGIGGFSYAAEKLVGGFETVAFVEREPYCQKVLRKHWHNVPIFSDIRSFDGKEFRDADIVVGGFPCQPWSVAGKQEGHLDEQDRDLWHEMVRVIEDIRPRWIIGENVRGFVNMPMGLKRSLFDLESIGYKAAPFIIPACAADAKHRRERCWIVGHTEHDGSSTSKVRRSYNPNAERTSEGSQQTFQFKGASGREHNEDVAHSDNDGLERGFFETRNEINSGENTQSEWTTDTKDVERQSDDGGNKIQSKTNGTVQGLRNGNEKELTKSTRVRGIHETTDNNREAVQKDKDKEDNNRTLVQERQGGVQSPKHRGLGKDKTSLERNKIRSGDDNNSFDRVEKRNNENVAHTESNGLLPGNGGLCGGEPIGLHGDEERNGNEVRSETVGCGGLQGETREADDVAHANSDTERRTHGKDVGVSKRGREDIDSGKRNKVRSDTSDSSCDGREKEKGDVPYTNGSGLQGLGGEPGSISEQEARHSIGGNSQEDERDRRLEIGSGPIWWKPEPRVGRVAHGVSNRTHRIKSLGNSIVPQVAARLFWAIKEAEK